MSPNDPPASVRVRAVSGSLRAGGSNNAVLDAAQGLAPAGVEVVRYGGLGALPAFDPDRDTPAGGALPRDMSAWSSRSWRSPGRGRGAAW